MKKFLIITMILFGLGCSKQSFSPPVRPADFIKIGSPVIRDFKQKILTFGYVKALKKYDIVAYTDGIVKNIFVKDGEFVKKGEKLLALEGLYKVIEEQSGSLKGPSRGIIKISPIDGYVSIPEESVGRAVRKGEVVASVFNLNKVLIESEVFGEERLLVRKGEGVYITTEGLKIKSRVYSVQPVVDYVTGGRVVEVLIEQKDQPILFPGDFVRVEIVVKIDRNKIGVPKTAVICDGKECFVFVQKKKNLFKKVKVKTGISEGKFVEIKSGLKGNEKIVIEGAYELFNKNLASTMKVED